MHGLGDIGAEDETFTLGAGLRSFPDVQELPGEDASQRDPAVTVDPVVSVTGGLASSPR